MTQSKKTAIYHGWLGNNNIGDEACYLGVKSLLHGIDVIPHGKDDPLADLDILGGGTIFRMGTRSLVRSPGNPPIVMFGSGVEPHVEMISEAKQLLDDASLVGLRGPLSYDRIRDYRQDIEIIGDPAISIPCEIPSRNGKVIALNIGSTRNYLWGTEQNVFEAACSVIKRFIETDYKVVLFAMWPEDNIWLDKIMDWVNNQIDVEKHPFIGGIEGVNDIVKFLSTCSIVVGEKLHASVLSFVANTPFISWAYREKCEDFCRSVFMNHYCVRTDDPNLVLKTISRIEDIENNYMAICVEMQTRKNEFMSRQVKFANKVRDLIGAKNG